MSASSSPRRGTSASSSPRRGWRIRLAGHFAGPGPPMGSVAAPRDACLAFVATLPQRCHDNDTFDARLRHERDILMACSSAGCCPGTTADPRPPARRPRCPREGPQPRVSDAPRRRGPRKCGRIRPDGTLFAPRYTGIHAWQSHMGLARTNSRIITMRGQDV